MRDGERFSGILAGFKAGMLFVGSIIGAGFSSGKEILTFFAGGNLSLVFTVIISGILFYLTGHLFFNLGRRIQAGSLFKITEKLFKKFGHIFNFFIVFCYLILLAAMLAGVDALARASLNYNGFIPVFSIAMLLFSVIIVKKGIKGILNISSILVPIVLIFLTFVCIFTLSKNTVSDSVISVNRGMDFILSIYECLLYVSMNMLLTSAVLVSAGRNMNIKQIKQASLTASIIITVMIALILLTCRLNYSLIQGMDMPIVFLALRISPFFRILSNIIMSFAIFTTFISSLYPLKSYLLDFIPDENWVYVILCVTGFIISRLGFSYIVVNMYPVQGMIGLIFIIFCIDYFRRNALTDNTGKLKLDLKKLKIPKKRNG